MPDGWSSPKRRHSPVLAVDGLADQVGMTVVTGVLVDHVGEHHRKEY